MMKDNGEMRGFLAALGMTHKQTVWSDTDKKTVRAESSNGPHSCDRTA
jgi:hypothetical protein